MSIRDTARFAYGLPILRLIPLNDDGSLPVAAAVAGGAGAGCIMGGAGPFDYSGVDSEGAVALSLKIDNGAVESVNVDLTAAVAIDAVTVDELVTALTAISASWTFSKDATTGRLKGVPTSGNYWQAYGEFAEIARFGQGKGLKIIKSNTCRSFNTSPAQKDDQTQTTTDASGKDTEVIRSGYRKGFTGTIVDTARDPELMAFEGGVYDAALGTYERPGISSEKISFMAEAFQAKYAEGSNKEPDLVSYIKKTYRSCVLTVGEEPQGDAFTDQTYQVIGTPYKTPAGVSYADTLDEDLSITAFQALAVDEV